MAEYSFVQNDPILIGITGGIGAGKSVVSRVLRCNGYEVYDCDSRAKELMEVSVDISDRLKERFGEECYDEDGHLNRPLLASRIFSSPVDREWVNGIVHSAVRRDIEEWRLGRDIAFVESAILHTSGLDRICKYIWLVEAPEEIRIERVLKRGGISEKDLRARIRTQQSEFDLLPREKLIRVDNSGEMSLLRQIEQIFQK